MTFVQKTRVINVDEIDGWWCSNSIYEKMKGSPFCFCFGQGKVKNTSLRDKNQGNIPKG
jgi:hypothetical protein